MDRPQSDNDGCFYSLMVIVLVFAMLSGFETGTKKKFAEQGAKLDAIMLKLGVEQPKEPTKAEAEP